MGVSKFHRVTDIFDFTFKIWEQQDFKKIFIFKIYLFKKRNYDVVNKVLYGEDLKKPNVNVKTTCTLKNFS